MPKKVLIIGFVWPEPKSSAAGSRMMQLIEAFISNEFHVTFASSCQKTENAFPLDTIGVSQVSIVLNDSSFDDFIKQLKPEGVMFDRFMTEEQFGCRVAECCPQALRILDTEDLHFLRKGRHQAFKDKVEFNKTYLFNDIAKREIASIYRSDLSLIISQDEMKILVNDFKIDKSLLLYLPFMIETPNTIKQEQLPSFENRKHFITVGNFLHAPNYDAILYLKETIWPLIRKELPQTELHIYGSYASQKVQQLNNEQTGFYVKGFAKSVSEVMSKSRACLVPIRFGAGLKGKVIDAMKCGTPVVTTSIGAEGMYDELAPNGFIENDASLFAERAIQLYKNENLWSAKQLFGFEILEKRFDKLSHSNRFVERVKAVNATINAHRKNNFIGQMLQHHTMQSTKFMSRWIEEKNK